MTDTPSVPFRLHIGGVQPKDGWAILNIQPGPHVDYVGSCTDLGRFADQSCDEVYASHVLEHLSPLEGLGFLREVRRILKDEGNFYLSVPDVGTLFQIMQEHKSEIMLRIYLMRMVFGGQIDEYDCHKFGYDHDILRYMLVECGFTRAGTVETFGLFDDTSSMRIGDRLISLNMIVRR